VPEAPSIDCRCPQCKTVISVSAASASPGQEMICTQCLCRFRSASWVSPEPPSHSLKAPGILQSGRCGPEFEHYREIGLISAIWQTATKILTEPSQAFATMRLDNGYGLPFLYASLIALVAGIATQIWWMLLEGLSLALGISSVGGALTSAQKILVFSGGGLLGIFCAIPQAPLYAASAMFISGGIHHLMLMLFKANRYAFEATARAMAYATTPAVLCVIPLFGWVLAPIWGMVTSIIALRETHETTTGVAVAAVFLPVGVITCCCCLSAMIIPFVGHF